MKEAKQEQSFVYILTNKNNSVFYTGTTNNLKRRIKEHREKSAHDFSCKYNIFKLVYFECVGSTLEGFKREKYIKGKCRKFKKSLIENENPSYEDLREKIT